MEMKLSVDAVLPATEECWMMPREGKVWDDLISVFLMMNEYPILDLVEF